MAVVEDSPEQRVAEMDFKAKIIKKESYVDVLSAVKNNEAFAALVNVDVAAYRQKEIEG